MKPSAFQDLTLSVRDLITFCHSYGKKNPSFDVPAAVQSLTNIGNALLSEVLKKGGSNG